MSRAWVVMTAMPPTKGHLGLIQFASHVGEGRAKVIVCTQPEEPFAKERYYAVKNAAWGESNGVDVIWLNRTLPQDPATPGFWDIWRGIAKEFGFEVGDAWVTSEPYGETMANMLGGKFIPYDPARELQYTKATVIREDYYNHFDWIVPEFQKHLRTNVTVFGAESTGKTTFSKHLAEGYNGHWFYEWARPYLETVGPAINVHSMHDIWRGQRATQKHSQYFYNKPFAIFDTDLFSTVGYWEQPHWTEALGPVPQELIEDAIALKSDLYVITPANIPFEVDPIRYGGTKQESPDDFWIDIAEKYGLNYVLLSESTPVGRYREVVPFMEYLIEQKQGLMDYDRQGY